MDLDSLSDLLRALENSRIAELELEEEGGRMLRLRRVPPSVSGTHAAPPSPHRPDEAAAISSLIRVEALLVGRFHLPQEPPALGDTVEEDQVLGVVESMGLMNPVAAPTDGRIAAIHVEEGQPVEYGQILFEIEPLPAP